MPSYNKNESEKTNPLCQLFKQYIGKLTKENLLELCKEQLTLNEWSFVAVTYDASNKDNQPSIYINGVLASVSTITPPSGTYDGIISDSNFACIGNRHDLAKEFVGKIAEVKVWNEILDINNTRALFRDQSPSESHIEIYHPSNFMSGSAGIAS